MYRLFPPIRPYVTHTLAVSPPHVLYVEECGSPGGLPVVVLHGGPGAGCEPYHRQFFDPEVYRVVLFDQRGSGRSTPHAELSGNTTQDLVGDIERLREHLGIERWVVFGGSWGSTLALAYAQAHGDRILALILRGIFLGTRREISWFYQDGANRFFPDYWQDLAQPIPEQERGDLVRAYYQRLTGPDELARMAAAKAWAVWEARTATLRRRRDIIAHFGEPYTALSLARLEAHYFVNGCFLEDNQLLRDAKRLHGIPGTIVHGRYDVICTVDNALALHGAWPDSELRVVQDAGHAASEPGNIDALVRATLVTAERLR
jgi:proline iminopeptidase